jgi:hypothetical protein
VNGSKILNKVGGNKKIIKMKGPRKGGSTSGGNREKEAVTDKNGTGYREGEL